MNVLAITDIMPNGETVALYAKISTGNSVGGEAGRFYIDGICEGNRLGFSTWIEAARYINATWPSMPIQGSPA
jgi:hypothetical protein